MQRLISHLLWLWEVGVELTTEEPPCRLFWFLCHAGWESIMWLSHAIVAGRWRWVSFRLGNGWGCVCVWQREKGNVFAYLRACGVCDMDVHALVCRQIAVYLWDNTGGFIFVDKDSWVNIRFFSQFLWSLQQQKVMIPHKPVSHGWV